MNSLPKVLISALDEIMICDKILLKQRLLDTRNIIFSKKKQQCWQQEIERAISASQQRVLERRDAVPTINYAENLPINQKRQEILEAMLHYQVIIIAGDTGSGKTTQIPKICLDFGRGINGMIGHTQPRRLAVFSVATRIAAELNTPLGHAVGYKVRFHDKISTNTLVKLMTDGILLAEINQDRLLLQYDTLIIDEAHERSLNIDFIIGYLHQLLPRRPDLKVIITSATIDPERFARYFDHAPIIKIFDRTYPVEVRYRPLSEKTYDNDEDAQIQGIYDAVQELRQEECGDILIFLSSEREIRDTAEGLKKLNLSHTEVLPLYARLSHADQNRIFHSHSSRRIILSTNVAETSLTVPCIKYVIDSGMARISRYSVRTKIQRLPIEPISQASANQRKGRCGRLSAGICIRLYSKEDFLSRQEFTDPEILRTNLASVILKMMALDIGDIATFPFLAAPDKRHINDGIRLLKELGALECEKGGLYRLSRPIGQQLAQLPLDPRLGRMVIAARSRGCLREVMIIASGLSIYDPRERPIDKKQASDEKHHRFTEKESDFLTLLNLWDYLQKQKETLSSIQFRRQCRVDFLSYARVREWQDIYIQLCHTVKLLGIPINVQPADYRSLHSALLTGLLSNIGQKDNDNKEYTGTRNVRFLLYPGSILCKIPPKWTMVAYLVETNRLWGRIAARIEADWIEPLAPHLIKRSYSEIHWDKEYGSVIARERVTLLGLNIIIGRKVNYSAIDPVLCRTLFIRHALVEGDWKTRHAFSIVNRQLIDEIEELEHKSRRKDILVDDETLVTFYNERLGDNVVSTCHFDSWWREIKKSDPHRLNLNKTFLVRSGAKVINIIDYPNYLQHENITLKLSYLFDPSSDDDGVTVHIPLSLLNQVSSKGFDWHIPGMRRELVIALIKSLPKPLRRNFIPATNYADSFLACIKTNDIPLLEALEHKLLDMSGVTIDREAWQLNQLPNYLTMTFRIIDKNQRTVAKGKDLNSLKEKLQANVQSIVSELAEQRFNKKNIQSWTFGAIPKKLEKKKMVI